MHDFSLRFKYKILVTFSLDRLQGGGGVLNKFVNNKPTHQSLKSSDNELEKLAAKQTHE